jgi:starch-binding outer membrane protein, SusD/RagB family
MTKFLRSIPIAVVVLVVATGCKDWLTCGECINDPNRPTAATNTQLFVGVQSNITTLMGSDMARVTGIFAQQFSGGLQQYLSLDQTYEVSEQTTNGFHTALYAGGGLVDVRKLEAGARAKNDSLFLGIAEVQEAMLMGTGADLFGDLVYSQALTGTPNPPLDKQFDIYDAIQKLLDDAIKNLATNAASNAGPGDADLVYGGDPTKWTKLAHTLKARFYLHTAELRGLTAYASAVNEAKLGIMTPADNFVGVFSGSAGEQNFYYQFDLGGAARGGYLIPNQGFVQLLQSRGDPRLNQYFDPARDDLSDARLSPSFTQPFITANENLLIWAYAAIRSGDQATAFVQFNNARALAGLGPEVVTGTTLLTEILTEKYIAEFQTIEAWNDYKATCWPNLTPNSTTKKIPARLPYDASERQTDTNIPALIDQPIRNANDPPNSTDPTGAVCKGQ